MNPDSRLFRDINRLETELIESNSELEVHLWKSRNDRLNHEGDIQFWLEYREQLEIENSLQHLKSFNEIKSSEKNKRMVRKTIIQSKKKVDESLSRRQRLWRKFLRDPHAYFADSSKFHYQLISKVIPKRKHND